MASTDARPDPIKGVKFRLTLPMFDSAGDLKSGATALDSEVCKNTGGFADCTNESTEIGSTGIYYLDLTSTEMDADTVSVIVKASDAQTTPIVMYPRPAPLPAALTWGTAQAGAAGSITLAATESATADLFNWCLVSIVAGTGAGQSRLISDYSTGRVASVADNWTTNPSSDSVYVISGLGIQPISATAASNLEAAAGTMIQETVQADDRTTETFRGSSALESTNDFYNGCTIIFLTGSLALQRCNVTDYVGATRLFTVPTLTGTPAENDTFIII